MCIYNINEGIEVKSGRTVGDGRGEREREREREGEKCKKQYIFNIKIFIYINYYTISCKIFFIFIK